MVHARSAVERIEYTATMFAGFRGGRRSGGSESGGQRTGGHDASGETAEVCAGRRAARQGAARKRGVSNTGGVQSGNRRGKNSGKVRKIVASEGATVRYPVV